MLKQIKKLTALLFVAATMFTFASCNKDENEDNPSGGGGSSTPTLEEQIIGKWAIPQNVGEMHGGVMEIKADHTMKVISDPLNWTLDGRVLHGVYDAYNQVINCDLTIGDINETSMNITGTYKYYRAGNLYKEWNMDGTYNRIQ